jgi:hypothetical protein
VRAELFVQIDAEVEQPEVATAVVQVDGGVHFVLVREDIRAVSSLVGDEGIERDVISCFFCSQDITSGVGRSCFQGEAVGRPDGGKAGFEGDVIVLLLFTTPAFTGESKSNHCDQQSTDERSAHQFSPFYSSWFEHYQTKIVN